MALIGESGSGKTLTSLSIIGLLDSSIFSLQGEIFYKGKNLLSLSEKELSSYRLQKIALVYQEPMSSFNPILRLDKQVYIALHKHAPSKKH